MEITDPRMVKAKDALANWQEYEQDHFYKSGNAMDEHGQGGFRAIWAEQLVELGADEGLPQIQEQISNALNAFRGALLYSTPDDFSKKATFRGQPCRYYIKGSTFPAANHISILEKTRSWRSLENLEMVRKSFWHCKEIMKKTIMTGLFILTAVILSVLLITTGMLRKRESVFAVLMTIR